MCFFYAFVFIRAPLLIRLSSTRYQIDFFNQLEALADSFDQQHIPFAPGSPFVIREPFPPILVPPKKPQAASYHRRLSPAWEDILYMGHRPPAARQYFEPNFVAVELQHKRPPPPAPEFSDIPLEFLRHQFALGLPLGSTYVGKEGVVDFGNMPLGALGTGGIGHIPKKGNPFEVTRRKEAADDLFEELKVGGRGRAVVG